MRLRALCCLILQVNVITALQKNVILPALHEDVDFKAAFARLVNCEYTQIDRDASAVTVPALQASIVMKETRMNKQRYAEMLLRFDCKQGSDFGWLCQQLYANRRNVEKELDLQPLRVAIVEHLNASPPEPGHQPPLTIPSQPAFQRLQQLLECKDSLEALRSKGYVVLNDILPSDLMTLSSLKDWTEQLQNTGQGDHIRTDHVHFHSRQVAETRGWAEPFDLLMACATILNDQLHLPPSPSYTPIHPATLERPLTVPKEIQYAEYKHGDFYKAHSDNSLTNERAQQDNQLIRSNFRAYTCILYMNDQEWNLETDGGALRLWPYTQHLRNVDDAQSMDYVDVAPKHGRLLVFDSCLVHSVQKVKHQSKVRRALTLWINRPNDSGVKGEVYF
ncbi:hypothetical protein MPSEU_000802900 [Mayamaea pseudoterrestris]|nr:hypothetical protein MPSEU_000802900 [Mayamaea pseudoterrestris]